MDRFSLGFVAIAASMLLAAPLHAQQAPALEEAPRLATAVQLRCDNNQPLQANAFTLALHGGHDESIVGSAKEGAIAARPGTGDTLSVFARIVAYVRTPLGFRPLVLRQGASGFVYIVQCSEAGPAEQPANYPTLEIVLASSEDRAQALDLLRAAAHTASLSELGFAVENKQVQTSPLPNRTSITYADLLQTWVERFLRTDFIGELRGAASLRTIESASPVLMLKQTGTRRPARSEAPQSELGVLRNQPRSATRP